MKSWFSKYRDLLVLAFFSLLTVWPLFLSGYFSHHDDLQVIRIFEMRGCFSDFQIPCRWVSHMGYGNGFPLFNYYNPFPYYLGSILSYVFGFIGAAKSLFFIPLVLGGFSMYFLAKELFGKEGGLISGILFLFAPYRAVDSYVRGAVAESFAISILPLILFFSLRLIKGGGKINFAGFALSLAIFLTSHNISALYGIPLILVWVLLWLYLENFKNIKVLFLSFILGIGLSSFFILPAYLERNLVTSETLTRLDLDFRAHFVTVSQLFGRAWGYGASVLGPKDALSFQIGWPHWFLVVISLFTLFLAYKKINKEKLILYFFLLAIFLFSIFMTHNKSTPIWESMQVLSFIQFPWRFLAVSVVSSSLIGGFLASLLKGNYRYLIILLVFLIPILNWNYFRPNEFYPEINDNKKLSGSLWEAQLKGSILDYLPKTAVEPKELAPKIPVLKSGEVVISSFENRSNRWSFAAEVNKESLVEVPIFYFPNWTVEVDGNKAPISNENLLGRISVKLSKGQHKVVGEFRNTPIRLFSNTLSLFSFLVFLYLIKYGKVYN